jgi:hypothetical protein
MQITITTMARTGSKEGGEQTLINQLHSVESPEHLFAFLRPDFMKSFGQHLFAGYTKPERIRERISELESGPFAKWLHLNSEQKEQAVAQANFILQLLMMIEFSLGDVFSDLENAYFKKFPEEGETTYAFKFNDENEKKLFGELRVNVKNILTEFVGFMKEARLKIEKDDRAFAQKQRAENSPLFTFSDWLEQKYQ